MKTSQLVSLFGSLKTTIASIIIFMFPLFFLPTTQEYFMTNKMYLLAFGALVLMAISTIEFIVTRKFVWKRRIFDSAIVLFLLAMGLSTLLSSPNKIQALLNPNFGLVSMTSLAVLYYYLSRDNNDDGKAGRAVDLFSISGLITSVVAIVFFFNPLKSATLPVALQFLKSPYFSTFGDQLGLAVVLGFFVVLQLSRLIMVKHLETERGLKLSLPTILGLLSGAVAFGLTLYSMFKPQQGGALILPPFDISWYAAVEILKNPMTALFGVGVDNFSSIFAAVKDQAYNQSPLWQIQSFNAARSTVLHIFTETGIFGILGFGLLIGAILREMSARARMHGTMVKYILPVGVVLAALLLLPVSLPLMFVLIVTLLLLENKTDEVQEMSLDVKPLLPVYLGMLIVGLLFLGGSAYLLSRAYAAEMSFKKGIDGIAKDNIADLYNGQRNAIVINPFIERYRSNFAQTNMLIANNIAQKAAPQQGQKPEDAPKLSDQERQQITQAIEAAISEAKAALSLNPSKAANWENLANIYRNVVGIAQGADVWTISSYQRAIVLDPQNPIYRVELGGVYYSLKNFDDAQKLFEQAVSIKPDWSNARYNLAWSAFQKGNVQQAVEQMQTVLQLIDPKSNQEDYKRASSELEEFKKKLPKQEAQSTQSATPQQPQQLKLPTPPVATVEPKLKLPQGSSPEQK